MTQNIQDKVDKIFADEYINNKRLLFSPKAKIPPKNNKNNNDNQINATVKVEKTTENTNYRTSSSKNKKPYVKKIKDNSNKCLININTEKKKENNFKNEKNERKETSEEDIVKIKRKKKEEKIEKDKKEKETQEKEAQEKEKREKEKREKEKREKEKREKEKREKEKKEKEKKQKEKEKEKEKEKQEKEKQEKEKQEKEKKEKQDNEELDFNAMLNIDDDDYLTKYQSKRNRGKSHHIKSKIEVLPVFKGILNKDFKNKKKPKIDYENIKGVKEKIEEEEDNNLSDETISKGKEKNKNRNDSISKTKKSVIIKGDALNKIRGSIIGSKNEVIKNDENSICKSNSRSPNLKSKKKQKVMSTTKYIKHKNSREKSINSNVHLSQKKINQRKKSSKLVVKKDSFNASIIFSNNDADSNNDIGSPENGNKKEKEIDKDKDIDFVDFKISDSSDFKSSQLSNDSEKKPEPNTNKKSLYQNNKSSKCVEYLEIKKTSQFNNLSKKNMSHKKLGFENINKDEKKRNKSNKKLKYDNNKDINSKKEDYSSTNKFQSKDSCKIVKNYVHRFESHITNIKPLRINTIINNSEIKKVKNKKKKIFSSQFQISKKVNNIFIANGNGKNNNIYESSNHKMNIINPGTFISIEYNLNKDNKNNNNIDNNCNNGIINNYNNGNTNNLSSFRRVNQDKNKIPDQRDNQENNQASLIKDIIDCNDSETRNNQIQQKKKEYNDDNNNNIVSNSNNNPVIYKNSKNKKKCFCCL